MCILITLTSSELQSEAREPKQKAGKRKRKKEEDESSEDDEEEAREELSGEESTDGELLFP